MKLFARLSALASWTFFVVMGYFCGNTLEGGATIFWIGSVVFYCIGGGLLLASWKRQRGARLGFMVLLPGLICGLGMNLAPELGDIGGIEVPLSFKIVDADTQKPIVNAFLRILSYEGEPNIAREKTEGRTGQDGTVNLAPELTYTYTSRRFYHSGAIRFWDRKLEITAEGYQTLFAEMSDFTGKGIRYQRNFYESPLPLVVLAIRAKEPLLKSDE